MNITEPSSHSDSDKVDKNIPIIAPINCFKVHFSKQNISLLRLNYIYVFVVLYLYIELLMILLLNRLSKSQILMHIFMSCRNLSIMISMDIGCKYLYLLF